MNGEREDAIRLANKILNRPNADPDDDLAILARQFLRANELALAQRSTERLVELSEPGGVGAFAARDHWKDKYEQTTKLGAT